MENLNKISKPTKSLNDMTLQERMEYQRVHDRAVILQASMRGASVELKTLGKKKHPFMPEYMQND